jgi:hypothetical protein
MSMKALHEMRRAKEEGITMEQPQSPPPRTKKQEEELLEYMYLDVVHGQEVWVKHYKLMGECPRYDQSMFDSGNMSFSDVD